ncbi:MAG: tyrosine phosphatase family protein [Beijerinckiaceae bacterium]
MMPFLQVCSLSRLAAMTRSTGASHVLTLINDRTPVERPHGIAADNHLFIAMSDILEPLDGHILPGEAHARRVIDFARGWDRASPMIVHCYAGVSRSTAGALIVAATLAPEREEHELARLVRRRSPTATPNLKLVEAADTLLKRSGRLLAAAESIGRGVDCFEGVPFQLEINGDA